MSNAILLSGYYGFENFGDDLILDVLATHLKSWGMAPIVLSGNPAQTSQLYDINSISRIDVVKIWQEMAHAKAFLSGGGGLFQDVTGPASPLYYGGLIEMAHWRKLPITFFGQGIGPIETTLGRLLTMRAIHHAGLVMVRDAKSQDWISRIVHKQAGLMADPVWAWEPSFSIKVPNKSPLGVSLRPWPQLESSYIERLGQSIAQLPAIQEVGVNLIDCQAGSDIIPLAKLESVLKQYQIPCQWFSGANTARGIAQSSALIGMRYHAVLTAAKLAIPIITLSYDPKVRLLSEQLALVDFPLTHLESLTTEQLQQSLRLADPSLVEKLQQSALEGLSTLKQWLETL